MSFILHDPGNVPAEIWCKATSNFGTKSTVKIENISMSLDDFMHLARYVITNTDLISSYNKDETKLVEDPRIVFLKECANYKVVDGWSKVNGWSSVNNFRIILHDPEVDDIIEDTDPQMRMIK